MLQTAFRPSCMNQASVFEWHKRFNEGRESVREELIGQRVKIMVAALRFYGSSGRDSVGKGQHSSNRVSSISARTMQLSITPSLSQSI